MQEAEIQLHPILLAILPASFAAARKISAQNRAVPRTPDNMVPLHNKQLVLFVVLQSRVLWQQPLLLG
jgi:hypothetical protein